MDFNTKRYQIGAPEHTDLSVQAGDKFKAGPEGVLQPADGGRSGAFDPVSQHHTDSEVISHAELSQRIQNQPSTKVSGISHKDASIPSDPSPAVVHAAEIPATAVFEKADQKSHPGRRWQR